MQGGAAMTDDDIEDAVFIAELQRRIARDSGNRIPLDEAMARLGITREELDEEDDDE